MSAAAQAVGAPGGPAAHLLGGDRLHLQHGPIDLIVMAEGPGDAQRRAFAAAARRFETILSVLVDELDLLHAPVSADSREPEGPVAQRMIAACRPHSDVFVTPMAAVAGAVADEVLAAMTAAAELTRAAVNNGGDIALHLTDGEVFEAAIATSYEQLSPHRAKCPTVEGGRVRVGAAPLRPFRQSVRVTADSPVQGIATSGHGGRSLSLGIADAVTVLARDAAAADVAATLIANAIDLPGHPAIRRAPADTVRDNSDLGARLVTLGCGDLSREHRLDALSLGAEAAQRMKDRGMIAAAALFLQGETVTVGRM